METVKLVRQSILINDWTVSIDLTDAYLHVQILHDPYSIRRSGLQMHGLILWNVPRSVDVHQIDGHNSIALASTCHLIISVPGRLAYKRTNSQPASISHNILPPNCLKTRFHSKSKQKSDLIPAQKFTFIGMEFLTQQN